MSLRHLCLALLVLALPSLARAQLGPDALRLKPRSFEKMAPYVAPPRLVDEGPVPGSGGDDASTICLVSAAVGAGEFLIHLGATRAMFEISPPTAQRWFANTVKVDKDGVPVDEPGIGKNDPKAHLCAGGGGPDWRVGNGGCMALGYARGGEPGMLGYHAFMGAAEYATMFAIVGRGDGKFKSKRFRYGLLANAGVHLLWSAIGWLTPGDSHALSLLTPVVNAAALVTILDMTYRD